MFGGMISQRFADDVPGELRRKLEELIAKIGDEIGKIASEVGVPKGTLNGVKTSNVVAAMTADMVFLLFERTHSPSTTFFILPFQKADVKPEDIAAWATQECGYSKPSFLAFPRSWLSRDQDQQLALLGPILSGYVADAKVALNRPRAVPGFEHMQPVLDMFSGDHPHYDRNVFVAMGFKATPQNERIFEKVSDKLSEHGLFAHRSDKKTYSVDGDLWTNVCVYMMGCKYGVCVFEEIEERAFNPNVQIEYGFLRACNKKVLLLKDRRQPKMPSDIVGKIYREFDSYDIEATIDIVIADWLSKDLHLSPRAFSVS